MRIKFISVILTFTMLLMFAPTLALAGEKASGTCGDNLTWVLDDSGTLTVSGTGDMYDYSSGDAPWDSYSSDITAVEIDEGVTSIGSYAFCAYSELTSVTIPISVAEIGNCAFYKCSALAGVYYAGSQDDWYSLSYSSKTFDSHISVYLLGSVCEDGYEDAYVRGTAVHYIPSDSVVITLSCGNTAPIRKVGFEISIDTNIFEEPELENIEYNYEKGIVTGSVSGSSSYGDGILSLRQSMPQYIAGGSVDICKITLQLKDGVTISDEGVEIKLTSVELTGVTEDEDIIYDNTDADNITVINPVLTTVTETDPLPEWAEIDTSGNAIAAEVSDDGTICVSLTSEDDITGTVTAAEYGEGGRLLEITTVDAEEFVEMSLKSDDYFQVKVFWWYDAETPFPMAEYKTIG